MVGFRIPQQHQGIGCFIVLVPAVGGERAAPSYVGRDPVTFDALAFMGGEVLRITLHQQPGLFRGPHVGQDLYLQHCRIGVVRLAREPCLHLLQGFGKSPVFAERGDCRPCAVVGDCSASLGRMQGEGAGGEQQRGRQQDAGTVEVGHVVRASGGGDA